MSFKFPGGPAFEPAICPASLEAFCLSACLFSAGFMTVSYYPPLLYPMVRPIPDFCGMESLLFISALLDPGPPKLATALIPGGPEESEAPMPPPRPGCTFF